MSEGKQKVNVCFNCGDLCYSTEHHVKEHGKEITVELCEKCHISLNHYQEEALPKLQKFLDENS
jgi:heterodisulfide reductase subunit B